MQNRKDCFVATLLATTQPRTDSKILSLRAKRNNLFKLFVVNIIIGLLTLAPQTSLAEEIYRQVDEQGNVSYSSKPQSADAKPAKLPEINRENIDRKIDHIKEKTLTNCIKHGGIDCTVGPDKDGSVVCLDGFKDAVASFNASCSEAKLDAQTFYFIDQQDQVISDVRNIVGGKFLLNIRNNSSVDAKNIAVTFKAPFTTEVKAHGPDIIAAYGVGEYFADLRDFKDLPYIRALEGTIFSVSCKNCPGLTKGKLQYR